MATRWSNEQWETAKQAFIGAKGRDGALVLASEKSGIPHGTLKQRCALEQWWLLAGTEGAVEAKLGTGIITDLSNVIRDWMSEMVNGIGRSLEIFKAMDAKGAPTDWPTVRIREDTIKLHQDRVRSLLGLDQQGAESSRSIGADWKPAKIIEVTETEKPPSTKVEDGLTGVEKG